MNMTKYEAPKTMMVGAVAAAFVMSATLAHADDAWLTVPKPAVMPAANDSGLAPVNGIKMYYAVYGDADTTPILLIHGGVGHGDIWSAQVNDLSKDHRVIVADSRGHGRTANDGSTYSYELLASDYVALLDHLEVDKAHLVGWSDGANIGFQMSLSDPGRLASHFAQGGNVTVEGINPTVETNAVFGAYFTMMGENYTEMSPTPDGFDAFVNDVVAMWGAPLGGADALQPITVPTVVVHGEHEEAILKEHAEEIAAAIPSAELLILDGVSHFSMLQDPDGYNAAVRAFISE